ncbi:MAG TPA: methylmalonyl Co-A mutase-associated GTPase MeaB [Anaerolineae bacterium]
MGAARRSPQDLIETALGGNRRALAQLISLIETDPSAAAVCVSRLHPRTGRAAIIGVTGSPGTGKSTLVNELAKAFRRRSQTVGIVAVDPSSPFTGGALLGDRIRMRDLAGDDGVFIRSMATRGSLGGLARSTADVVRALDAVGYAAILIETVGAGQSEVEIARTADTVLVVEAPGLGDEVQAIKAGILEIADVLVVNKADRDGADNTLRALQTMLDLGSAPRVVPHHGQIMEVSALASNVAAKGWRPPIVKTIAPEGKGVDELVDAIDRHRAHLEASGEGRARRRVRAAAELEAILRETLLDRLMQQIGRVGLDGVVDRIVAREIDPYTAARALTGE